MHPEVLRDVEPTEQRPALEPLLALNEVPEHTLSPGWPLKLPLDLTLMALMTLSLWLPLAGERPVPVAAGMLVAPLVIAAFGLRVCFEALIVRFGRRRLGSRILLAAGITALVAVAIDLLVGVLFGLRPSVLAPLQVAACVMATASSAALVRSAEGRLGASSRRVFFVGSQDQYVDLSREAGRRGDLRLVGRLPLEAAQLYSQEELVKRITGAGPTTLVLSAESIRDDAMVAVASELHLRGLRVRGLSDFYEQQFAKIPVSDLSKAWFLFDVAEIHRARVYGPLKRVVEGTVAGVLLVLSAPLMPFLALAVRASGPGPVLHRNVRVGKDGRLIRLTKLRTMTLSDDTDEVWATSQSDRITRVGRYLRRYRLDEIPQLWHVLRGDVSLVGPRPEQPQIVRYMQESIEFYAARHCVRPGITGWAQVNHGYAGSLEDTIEKLQYEFFYIKRQSLAFDLVILLATIRTILSGRGR